MLAGSRGALLCQSAVGNSRIVLPPWALSAASSPRAQHAHHLGIHAGGPGIALGPTWQAPIIPWKPARCSRQLPKCTKICVRKARKRCWRARKHSQGAPRAAIPLPIPCHHVCPWCASPWATVGSLKPHLEWSGHRNSNCGEMFARDWCVTVVTDLPDVETEQNKGCVTHKTYDPSPGNTPFSLPSSP